MDTKRPIHEIRLGKIKAAIWANETKSGIRHNVTVERIYKEDGVWKRKSTFGRDELPLVCKVLDFVHTWIFENSNSSNESSEEKPEEKSHYENH